MDGEQFYVLNPVAEVWAQTRPWAPRPSEIGGLKVGLIDNTKSNADRLLLALADLLSRKYRLGGVAHYTRPQDRGSDDFLDDVARRCHLVISGVGD